VGLIGVASVGRHDGQVGWVAAVDPGHEAAEPQHPAQQHRTIADRRAAATVQLPFADAETAATRLTRDPGWSSRRAATATSGSGGPAAVV
jgi:hypothetical protein